MKILHGTWIPQAATGFIQQGGFYLWVETTEANRQRKNNGSVHPRHLLGAELTAFLGADLGIKAATPRSLESLISTQSFLLPSTQQPLPSLELARYLEEELPEEFEWKYWQITCYQAIAQTSSTQSTSNVIKLLNELHFIALHNLADVQLGSDLLFWYHYTQSFKQIILKDHYIPALKYRSLPASNTSEKTAARSMKATKTSKASATTKTSATKTSATKTTAKAATKTAAKASAKTASAKTASAKTASAKTASAKTAPIDTSVSPATASKFEIYAAWEIISEDYETNLQRYVEAMPLACVAGFASPPSTPQFHDKASLLRHFSECLLTEIVTHTPSTAAFDQKIGNTLLHSCLYPASPWTTADGLKLYRQWQSWRDRISRTQTAVPFYLCFQLQAPTKPTDPWTLEFQVAPKSDPSARLPLVEYWRSRPTQQKELKKQFGKDFEQHLLLNLGYAARIYPKLWLGLETDQPTEIVLNTETAFEFLNESAWVLENAGYKVIVPAWWTPKGRQRAKIRLKAKGKSAAAAGKSKSYFSFDTLVEYQYELAIGDQPISEKEWQQLVNAKSPLVQFRGQWMQLDREKMQQMLEFWKKAQQDNPEMSLLDFMRLTADSEDELELDWERDQLLSDMLTKLNDKTRLEVMPDPPGFQGALREYQKRGVSWLHYLESLGLNGCLADDMGLGKSAQVIARLLQEREQAQQQKINLSPTLLIAPTSVVGNWRKEIEKFAPQLRAVVHHGGQRSQDAKAFKTTCQDCDVLITSFTLARKDEKLLGSVDWHRLVVDEAQNIKNPKAAQTKAIAKIPAHHRLALTGTPVENRLLDLWSIFNFLNPGYLGKEAQFRQSFEVPIQKNNDKVKSATLKK
ncbi:MAG TPA: DEAD/DEAH box helicase, partial [Coleofasciculaceae cyanobacterium]